MEKSDAANPAVAVVIPCYRYAEMLPDAVAEQLIRQYPDRDITLLRQANRGLAMARNAGVRASTAPLILPLDADDKLAPSAVERMALQFTGDSRVDLVVPWGREFGDRQDRIATRGCTLRQLLRRNWLIYSSMYRREMFERVGGYNPNMRYGYEDWDFSIGVLEKGGVPCHLPDELFLYRKHGRTMLTDADDKSLWLRARIMCNHPDLFAPWRVRLLRGFW